MPVEQENDAGSGAVSTAKEAIMMRIVLVVFCGILGTATLVHADQEQEEPPRFAFVLGPRIGVSWTIMTPEDFSNYLRRSLPWFTGNYIPVNTLFGVTMEQRILLGETKSHFALREVLSVAGLEQSIVIPSLSILIGYRSYSGFEIGVGPRASLSGAGVVAAIGWAFHLSGAEVPLDISWVLPGGTKKSMGTVGLTTGFNLQLRREKRKR